MVNTSESSVQNAGKRVVKGDATYRGVHLQKAEGRSRFTSEQVKQAVEAAVSKHADALSGRIKA